jgi:hypothetical protein
VGDCGPDPNWLKGAPN